MRALAALVLLTLSACVSEITIPSPACQWQPHLWCASDADGLGE